MPLVGAAAITAGGVIVGGKIASNASKRAAASQEAAAREAIAYQERTQRERQARYDAAYADYKKRYDDYLEQFYGVKKPAQTPDGVKASAAGVPGTGEMSPISASSIAPMVSQVRKGDTIADLIRGIGASQANSATASGDIWGNAIAQAGTGLSKSLTDRPKTTPPLMGTMQPTGVTPAQAGIDTNAFNTGGWSDWDRYLYSGGV